MNVCDQLIEASYSVYDSFIHNINQSMPHNLVMQFEQFCKIQWIQSIGLHCILSKEKTVLTALFVKCTKNPAFEPSIE